MNEALIKKLIKYKLCAADAILGSMPPKVSDEIRSFGRVVLEGLNEGFSMVEEKAVLKSKGTGKLDNIPIE